MRLGQARYQLLDVLGHGAAGVVHLARDRTTRRFVAAKVLQNPSRDELARLRFLSEQNLSLDHPNLLRTLDWYQGPDQAVLVLELADAGTVADVLAVNDTVSPAFVEQVTRETLSGLAFLHAAGVLHRDLTPSNLMLLRDADRRSGVVVKIADLGVAILEGRPRLTQDASVVGTVGYIAPEVLAGGDHDERADMWALGRTLGQLAERSEPPVDPALAAVIEALVAEAAQDRPSSAAAALDSIPDLPMVDDAPPVLPRRTHRAVRGHRMRTRAKQSAAVIAAGSLALTAANVATRPGGGGAAASTGSSTTARPSGTASSTAALTTTTTTGSTSTTTVETTSTTSGVSEDATGTPVRPELALSRRECKWFESLSSNFASAWTKRLAVFFENGDAAGAFGGGFDVDISVLRALVGLAQNVPDQATNVSLAGTPDDLLAHALLVQWLVAAGAQRDGAVDTMLAIWTTRGLMLDEQAAAQAGVPGPERPASIEVRLAAVDGMIQRFVDAGCNADPRATLDMSDAVRWEIFGAPGPLTTLADFFARLDAALPSL